MTIDKLNEQIGIAVARISLLLKESHRITVETCQKAEVCDADPMEVMVSMMAFANSLNLLKAGLENDDQA